jgi:hypothetical protein
MESNLNCTHLSRVIISGLLLLSFIAIPAISPRPAASMARSAGAAQAAAEDDGAVANEQPGGTPFTRLPLRFELNVGQTDPQARYIVRCPQGVAFLTDSELALRVCAPASAPRSQANQQATAAPLLANRESAVVHIKAVAATPHPSVSGLDALPGKTNYFIGKDPRHWRAGVPSYARVKVANLYPGIDLTYYGNEAGQLEYDFNVAPGADPGQIALAIEGAEKVRIDESGDLVLQTAVGEVRQRAPRLFQQEDGARREIAGGYVFKGAREIGFAVASYDAGKELVIDPQLVYATYLGGTGSDNINGLAVDAAGAAYVTGSTTSLDFPIRNPMQPGGAGQFAFITKLSADGSSLDYSTFFGGSNGDTGLGIQVDSSGAAYVAGFTGSTDFPLKNPIQNALAGNLDLFVTKLNPDGASLAYSTYLGGSSLELPRGIQLDTHQNVYVFGRTASTNFPTHNPTQATYGGGNTDGFVAVINGDGAALLFSSYIGGSGDDTVDSLVLQAQLGNLFVFGVSTSPEFGAKAEKSTVFGAHLQPRQTAITKIKPADLGPFDALIMAFIDFLGLDINDLNADDVKLLIAVLSNLLFPSAAEAAQNQDIAIFLGGVCARIPPSTSCLGLGTIAIIDGNNDKATRPKDLFVIGNQSGSAFGRMVSDDQGALYLAGDTTDNGLPLVNPIQSTRNGQDAYVLVYPPNSHQPAFGTFIGGAGNDLATAIALDPQKNIYVAGVTGSTDFPTAGQPLQPGFHPAPGNPFFPDGWVAKISAVGPFQSGPDFSLSFDSPTVTGQAGTKARIKININRTGGFTGNVTVTPAFPGNGVKPKPAADITTTDTSVTFKYKIGGGVAGQFPLTFTAKDDAGKTRTATVTLIVQ